MKKRIVIIDFLKCFSILSIFLAHAAMSVTELPPSTTSIAGLGARGVQLFFILSGWTSYYAYHSITVKEIPAFYQKKFFSLAPGFYIMIMVWLFLGRVFPTPYFTPPTLKDIFINITFLHGILTTCSDVIVVG